jgi:hypothetical protein
MKASVRLFVVALIVILLLFSGSLYKQNRAISSENRRLMIMNDSVISANIELNRQLQFADSMKTKLSVSFKSSK